MRERRKTAEPSYLPVKLDIENVSGATSPARCAQCRNGPKGRRAADMPLDCFKRLIDEQYGLVEIKLNGIGEPLMQGDDVLRDGALCARAKRIWVASRRTPRSCTFARITSADRLGRERDRHLYRRGRPADLRGHPHPVGLRPGDGELQDAQRLLPGAWDHQDEDVDARAEGEPRAPADHVDIAAELGFRNLVFSLQLHGWGDAQLEARNHAEEVALDERR
jgi:hypothetical protein